MDWERRVGEVSGAEKLLVLDFGDVVSHESGKRWTIVWEERLGWWDCCFDGGIDLWCFRRGRNAGANGTRIGLGGTLELSERRRKRRDSLISVWRN